MDKFGRIGSRKPWTEFTTAVNVTYTTDPSTTSTQTITHRLGYGSINGDTYVLATVGVYQYNASGVKVQEDHFICKLTETISATELDEISYPTLVDSTKLANAQDHWI